jgi:dsRNA-specific ribonuclease
MQDVKATAEKIEAIIGYTFTNKSLCAEAAQMASPQTPVVLRGVITGLDNNKRLSILGNAVLAKAMCACWFDARDKQGENTTQFVPTNFIDTSKAKRDFQLTGTSSVTRSWETTH